MSVLQNLLMERDCFDILKVMKKLGFEGSLKDFFEHLRTDPKFYYKTKDEMMQAYRNTCYDQIRPTLTKIFKKIPKSPMVYVP